MKTTAKLSRGHFISNYNNETKIYADLNPSAPQEPQTYRLKELTEIEVFFLDEIEALRRQVKKKKRLNKATRIVGTGLITSAAITGGEWGGGASIPAFTSSVGLPVGAALGGLGVVFSFLTVPTRNFSRGQMVKQEKHDAIMVLAQSKLDSITYIISQAVQDGDISPTEIHKVLQEREKYRKLKTNIRN